ncbi:MAG TPA: hypothetical protein DCZ95_07030 [Verrucomicrobia bacterium]|nr:MAG: hypothetical protein A2X46_06250 [Lentisphaerae bacterium GWF2_57_35]HBA83829.1 hypothetical protein [Verrucomicrobiota bacterium]
MFNTSEQLPDSGTDLTHRLDTLGAFDPEAADRIRQALHGTTAPLKPALEPVDVQLRKAGTLGDPGIVILLGASGAEDLEMVFRRMPEHVRILLLESEPAAAADLFRACPLEELVQEGRLSLAIGMDEALVEKQFLSLVDLKRAPEVRVLEMRELSSDAANFYYSSLSRAKNTVHLNVFNLGTLVYRGPHWQYNTIQNLPQLIAHPGVARLEGLFAGKPAVIVGAGPSLNEALAYLPQAAGQAVIVSTGTALRPLRKAGLRPDLTVSVDASHLTARQFETCCDDLYLACSSLAYPPLLPKFRGLFSASMASNPISEWLNTVGESKGALTAAGTVTTSAIDLAIRMGCNPIICIGADLSFSDDGTTHVSNSMYHGSRLDPARLIRTPGNYQADVPTTEQFKCYIDLLENYIRSHPDIRFVNATTGGALIRGMELAHPSLLARLGGEPFDAYDAIARQHDGYEVGPMDAICSALRETVEQLLETMSKAHEAAMLCNQLIMMLKAPRPEDEAIARGYLETLRQIDRQLVENRTCSLFLDMSLWPISYRSGAQRAPHEEKYSESLLSNKRSRELYEQIAGAAKWTRHLLLNSIRQIEAGRTHAVPSEGELVPV